MANLPPRSIFTLDDDSDGDGGDAPAISSPTSNLLSPHPTSFIPLVPSSTSLSPASIFVFTDDHDVRTEERRVQVYAEWVRGKGVAEIARMLGHATVTVRSDIDVVTEYLRSIRKREISEAADRTVAHLRSIQQKCYEMLDDPMMGKQVSALLNTIVRCEEQIAKVEGVAVNRSLSLNLSEQRIKLYDFQDSLPPPSLPER